MSDNFVGAPRPSRAFTLLPSSFPQELKFAGAWLLSLIASLLFGFCLIAGLYALLTRPAISSFTLIAGIVVSVRQEIGAAVAIFGLFGLLLSRIVALLYQIELNSRTQAVAAALTRRATTTLQP